MEKALFQRHYQIPEARDLNFRGVQGACINGSKVSAVRPMGLCGGGSDPHGNCLPTGSQNIGKRDGPCTSGSDQALGCVSGGTLS